MWAFMLPTVLVACAGTGPTGTNTSTSTTPDNITPPGGTAPPEQTQCAADSECASHECIAGLCTAPADLNCPNDDTTTTVGACDNGNTFAPDSNPSDKLSVHPSDGALVLDTTQQTHSYIWIANTGENTISKIDTETYEEVARYKTGGTAPSRTSVNLLGEAVVGHRYSRHVTKFAPSLDQCVDKNSNGEIETYSEENGVLPFGDDECMLWSVKIKGQGGSSRAIATFNEWGLDGALTSDVWVGNLENGTIHKINGDTGVELLKVNAPVSTYGFAMDQSGTLWIASAKVLQLGRVDTRLCVDKTCDNKKCSAEDGCAMEAITMPRKTYGITVDYKQRVWLGGDSITRYDPAAPINDRIEYIDKNDIPYEERLVASIDGMIHGIAADAEGRIWGAAKEYGLVEVDADSMTVTQIVGALGDSTTNKGIGIDAQGKVWSIGTRNSAAVVTPSADGNHGYKYKAVKDLHGPYTYSDMTGQQLAFASHAQGYYRHTFSTCEKENATWDNLTWTADVPVGTRLSFRIRVGTDASDLSIAPWIAVGATPTLASPTDVATALADAGLDPTKALLQLEARLERLPEATDNNTTPRLYTFGVQQTGCGEIVL